MIRSKFRLVRHFIKAMSTRQHARSLIVFLVFALVLGCFIDLVPIEIWLKCTSLAISLILIICLIYVLLAHRLNEMDEASSIEVAIPPKPAYSPASAANINIDLSNDPTTVEVLKEILATLRTDALRNEEKREAEQKAAELREQILLDKTVSYDKSPGFAYYLKRGLWRTIIALVPTGIVILVTVNIAQSSGNASWLIAVVITALLFCWYAIRWYLDWIGLRRKIVGNSVIFKEPMNAFFGLIGEEYQVSILDCGNIAIRKTWYERIFSFIPIFRSARVSMDTRITDENVNAKSEKARDVFRDMSNMRDPEKFREIITRRHDELTLGQPGVIRRSEE